MIENPPGAWTPDEFDRLRAAGGGLRFGRDGRPLIIAGPDGRVPARRSARIAARREAWRRAIAFWSCGGCRHGRLPTKVLGPHGLKNLIACARFAKRPKPGKRSMP